MKRLSLRKLTASALVLTLLTGSLAGCDDIFRPVDNGNDSNQTNPYIHWDETSPSTSPTETTAPEEEGEIGYITGKLVNLRAGPGTNFDSLGTLPMGTEVRILEKRAEDGVLWGLTEAGWISMNYVSLDSGAPILTGTITAKSLNVRSGPGTGYDVVGTVKKGDQVNILVQEASGSKIWGRIATGWISMDYVNITGSIAGEPNDTPPPPTVTDTTIVGSWVCMEEQNYFDGQSFTASTWTFRKDGTCTLSTDAYVYKENLGWQSKGSPTQRTSTYTFDGRTLSLDGESLSISVTGDIMEVYSHRTYSLMLRSHDVNALIRELIKRDRSNSDKTIFGSWTGAQKADSDNTVHGSQWYFGTDGSFSCSVTDYLYEDGKGWYAGTNTLTYSGVYFYDGSRLTLCYETETNSTTLETRSDIRYAVLSGVSISGSSMNMPSGIFLMKDSSILNVIAAISG